MKRKCKKVDITNYDFIKSCIEECLKKKGKRIYSRSDVKSYVVEEHDADFDSIARELQNELLNHQLILPEVKYKYVIDKGNQKLRKLTVEHIKRQFYNYIAYNGLNELDSRLGNYHISPIKRVGTQECASYVKGWLKDTNIRYAIQADISKCYESITHQNMMNWLNKHVKNDELLWLINELLESINEGLSVGSYLSIKLSALYLSDLYHHTEDSYVLVRRGKKTNVFKHQLIYADDIFLFGSNARSMKKAFNEIVIFTSKMGLSIKNDWKLIDLSPTNSNAHIDILGYKVYRNRITMRRRNYLKTKATIIKFKNNPNSVALAKSLIARVGINVLPTDSYKFSQKYDVNKYYIKARKVVSRNDKSSI